MQESSFKKRIISSWTAYIQGQIHGSKKLIDFCLYRIIPSVYAGEYLNLSSNNKVKDRLDETDEEDNNITENNDNIRISN